MSVLPGHQKYTQEDITRGLVKILECRGNIAEASRRLNVPYDTVYKWATDEYAQQFVELERAYGEEIEREIVLQARENARKAGEIVREGLDGVAKQIERGELEGKELAAATYQVAKIMGTNVDKVLAMTGRPTNGREAKADLPGLIRDLAGSGVIKLVNSEPAVDGTAEEELPPA